jgi:hypothetical protein
VFALETIPRSRDVALNEVSNQSVKPLYHVTVQNLHVPYSRFSDALVFGFVLAGASFLAPAFAGQLSGRSFVLTIFRLKVELYDPL